MMEVLRANRLTEYIAKKALAGTVVLSGISAGAILPMSWGHSDSLSYRPETETSWQYVRVDGLGLVPFAITPHFNTTHERLGERSEQFKDMLKTEPTIPALGVDNLAAIRIVDGHATQFQSDPGHYVHVAQHAPDGRITFAPMTKDDSIKLS